MQKLYDLGREFRYHNDSVNMNVYKSLIQITATVQNKRDD